MRSGLSTRAGNRPFRHARKPRLGTEMGLFRTRGARGTMAAKKATQTTSIVMRLLRLPNFSSGRPLGSTAANFAGSAQCPLVSPIAAVSSHRGECSDGPRGDERQCSISGRRQAGKHWLRRTVERSTSQGGKIDTQSRAVPQTHTRAVAKIAVASSEAILTTRPWIIGSNGLHSAQEKAGASYSGLKFIATPLMQ